MSGKDAEGNTGWSKRGLTGRVMDVVGAWKRKQMERAGRDRMRLLETLALGPKKQLLLVSCDGEEFLVGTGVDGVQTIVRVRRAVPAGDEVPE